MEIITYRKLQEGLYQLSENISTSAAVQMYLVVGTEKAALIDTGYGVSSDLDRVVKTITDLPVMVLVTHCDPDHAGGAALFEDIYMSDRDQALMDNGSLAKIGRLATAQAVCGDPDRAKYFKNHLVAAEKFSYQNIKDGDVFDLGGRKLTAVAFPGHTEGSMCFWNQEEEYCLVGDAVANVASPVLFFKKCRPLEEYRKNLIHFTEVTGAGCRLYTGHNAEPLPDHLVPEILELSEEILQGRTEADQPYIPPFMKKPEAGASLRDKIKAKAVEKFVSAKELGDAVPMEHFREGTATTIKYNAKKIRV